MNKQSETKVDDKTAVPVERHSQTSRQAQHSLVEAVDRLVEPLDKILAILQAHARIQRVTALLAVLLFVSMVAIFAWMEQLRQANAELREVADVLSSKLTATEKKVDETQHRVSQQPEVKIVPDSSGKPGAVLVIKDEVKPASAASTDAASPGQVQIPLSLPSATTVGPR